MKKILLLFIIILLLPTASALEIVELEFFEFMSHGQPITAVSTGRIPNVDIMVIVSGVDFIRLEMNITSINRNDATVVSGGYARKVVTKENCQYSGGKYTCFIRNIELQLTDSSVIIPIKLFSAEEEVWVDYPYTFRIDNTKPEIKFIGTETCLNQKCYVASGKENTVKIEFLDPTATFNKKIVRYSFDGSKRFVNRCEGLTCYGEEYVTCESGEIIVVKIIPLETMDDAYNKIENSLRHDLICDNVFPEVKNVSVGTESTDYVKIGDTMVVHINVSEDLVGVNVYANFSEFGGGLEQGQCQPNNNHEWECRVTSTVTGDGPFTGKIKLFVEDIAGNTVEKVIPKQILGLDTSVTVNEWSVGSVQGMPRELNTDVIQHITSDVKIYYQISLSPRASDVEILEVTPVSCTKKQNKTVFKDGDFVLMNAQRGTMVPFIVGTIAARPDYEVGVYEYSCLLNIRSRKGKFYFTNYETENITISIELKAGGNVKTKIKEEATKVLDSWLLSPGYENFKKTYGAIETICDAGMGFTKFTKAYDVFYQRYTNIMDPLLPESEPLLEKKAAEADAVNIGNTAVLKGAAYEACALVTCASKFNKGEEFMQKMCDWPIVEVLETSSGQDCNTSMSKERSMFVAVADLCVPAVMEHMETLKAIKINYVECLVDGYRNNIPIYTCQETMAISQCSFWTGEFLNAFPGTAMVKEGLINAKKILRDPYAAFSLALPATCWVLGKVPFTPKWPHAVCVTSAKVGEFGLLVTDAFKFIKGSYPSLMDTTDTTHSRLQTSVSELD